MQMSCHAHLKLADFAKTFEALGHHSSTLYAVANLFMPAVGVIKKPQSGFHTLFGNF